MKKRFIKTANEQLSSMKEFLKGYSVARRKIK